MPAAFSARSFVLPMLSWLLAACLLCGAACQPGQPASEPPAEPPPKETAQEAADDAAQSAAASQAPLDVPPTGYTGHNTLSKEELDAGWIMLFDGETLFGWKRESAADWVVLEKAITVAGGEPGLLRTTAEFSDFVLRFEARYAPDANSGIFLRTPAEITRDRVGTDCYEVNIAPAEHAFPTGSLVGRVAVEGDWHHGELELADFEAGAIAEGEWQSWEISAWGDDIRITIDGQEALAYTDPNPLGRGYIALQYNEGLAAFRNIKLKPLGLAPLVFDEQLTGWQAYPELPSRFTYTEEGYLHIEDGPGQLETEATWGDFVLQLECLVNGDDLNSGIFFRSIPGERTNGYESQIHNGYLEGDRNRPADTGTGGLYRRVPARRVVSEDRVWFSKTIVANGPHFSVWVNGWQVTDWTDTRAPAENPREGLRLAPGTIIIQGHDPTTDLFFRNFRIGELRPRESE